MNPGRLIRGLRLAGLLIVLGVVTHRLGWDSRAFVLGYAALCAILLGGWVWAEFRWERGPRGGSRRR